MCAWYTPFTAHNAALEIDILNFNAKVEWTNALYHIMSNRKANSLTISTLLKWETLLDIEIGVAVAFTTRLQIAQKATNYSRFFFTLFTAYFATTTTTTKKNSR